MTTNTTKIAGEDMTDEQEIELRKLVLEYGLAAVIEGDQDRPRQLKRVVDYVRALLASKPAVPAAQDTPGWFVHNGATHTLEAAAEAAKTPQALAYAASQKAFLVLERICRAHGYNYQCVIHDWLEQALSTASPAAPAQSCGDAEQVAALAPSNTEPPHHIIDAAMDVARFEYGHGVTRASIVAIWKALGSPWYVIKPLGDAEQADEAMKADAAWEAYLNEQKLILGMPGLMAKPSFVAGYRAHAALAAEKVAAEPDKQPDQSNS